MTTQERIAAATIAQIFGNDLLTAQQSARTDSGAVPQFVKVHPKSILQDNQPPIQVGPTAEQQQMTAMLQREAELSFPLPESSVDPTLQPKTEPIHTVGLINTSISPAPSVHQSLGDNSIVLERIAQSLENIVQFLQSYTISLKRKRISRPRTKKVNEL